MVPPANELKRLGCEAAREDQRLQHVIVHFNVRSKPGRMRTTRVVLVQHAFADLLTHEQPVEPEVGRLSNLVTHHDI